MNEEMKAKYGPLILANDTKIKLLRDGMAAAVADLTNVADDYDMSGELCTDLRSIIWGMQRVLGATCDPEAVAEKMVPDAPTDTERLDALEAEVDTDPDAPYDNHEGHALGIMWNSMREGTSLREHANYLLGKDGD
jgi:hypothetical protein